MKKIIKINVLYHMFDQNVVSKLKALVSKLKASVSKLKALISKLNLSLN